MAIRLADTARPNNYVDAEHQGTFPVAYAEDVWFADGTRLSEKTFGGDSIQKEELPLAGTSLLGTIYQYIGTTGTYQNGCFYQCKYSEQSGWFWSPIPVVEKGVTYRESYSWGEFPIGTVIIYSGKPEWGMKLGHHYKYDSDKPLKLYRFTGVKDGKNVQYCLTTDKCEVGDGVFFYNSSTMYNYIKSVSGSTVTFGNDVVITDFAYANETNIITYTGWFDIGSGESGESGTLYADNPIGSIVPYGGTTAPSGWLTCNGRAVNRSTYKDLFDAIGTSYGAGDGSTTFNLPDLSQLKQDYSVKKQLDTWTSNLEDGSESHTITIDKDGSYYFEVVLANASGGKKSNNITITNDTRLISSWGYIGVNAQLTNKTIFLKKGTYSITHICQTDGIAGTSVVTVYSTRNEPVGSYIIKAKHTPVPADFMDAVDDAVVTAMTKYDYTIPYTEQNTLEKVIKELVRRIAKDNTMPNRSTFNVFLEWQMATIIQVNVAKFNANWVVVNGSSSDAMFWGGQVNNEWKWHTITQ